MKKFVTSVFVSVLAISTLQGTSWAASVAEGTKCSKMTTTTKVGTNTFTCSMSPQGLVWHLTSGSPFNSPTPKTSKASAPSTSPGKSATLTYAVGPNNHFIYKYINGVLNRELTNGTYAATDPRPASSFDPIRVAAFNAIHALPVATGHADVQINYVIESSYPAGLASALKSEVESTLSSYDSLFKNPIKLNVIMMTEQDIPTAQTILENYMSPSDAKFEADTFLSRYTKMDYNSGGGTGGGNVWYYQKPDGTTEYYAFFHNWSKAPITSLWPEIASHELTHAVQATYFKSIMYQQGDVQADYLPRNFLEGSANTIGMAQSVTKVGWFSDEANLGIRICKAGTCASVPMKTAANVVTALKGTEDSTSNSYSQDMQYPLGELLYEWIIGTYGMDGYHKILVNLQTMKADQNYQASIGLSKDQLYAAAAPWILKMWNNA